MQARRRSASRRTCDVQVLCAEAEMTVHAWKLWTPDGQPVPGTAQIEARLEAVLARDPSHPGANHYYVHVMEASPTPQRALAGRAAPARHDAGRRAPGAHAGAHPAAGRPLRGRGGGQPPRRARRSTPTWRRRRRRTTTRMYLAHNHAFLAYAAAMEGRKAETLSAVQALAADRAAADAARDGRLRAGIFRSSTPRWCASGCGMN